MNFEQNLVHVFCNYSLSDVTTLKNKVFHFEVTLLQSLLHGTDSCTCRMNWTVITITLQLLIYCPMPIGRVIIYNLFPLLHFHSD